MVRRAAAFCGLSTDRVTGAGAGVRLPSGPMTSLTRCGCTYVPSLAMAAYAAAICSGVASTLCPIGTDPYDEPLHSSAGSSRPAGLPGHPLAGGLTQPEPLW